MIIFKTIATASLVLALGLSAAGAQAETGNNLTAGADQSQVGMLLPAVQSVREAARKPSTKADSSDFLEDELRKFFRNIMPME
ncbi:hypothetical protein [Parasphingorhabdus sp.]|uniref:hypothetical protein n=1 Tax=Parasphingorhabdus sp. TaxID=2709688 RepID=UPI003C76978A